MHYLSLIELVSVVMYLKLKSWMSVSSDFRCMCYCISEFFGSLIFLDGNEHNPVEWNRIENQYCFNASIYVLMQGVYLEACLQM